MELLGLEQQRLALESNLQQLRQDLKHWHTWEAEYEGLKEEILSLKGDLTSSQLESIAQSYNGDLLNEKEILELARLDQESLPRSAQEIIALIERRQKYVHKKIERLQKQFFEAEAKSEELAFAAAREGNGGEAGLPLTEIHEELDDEGNVVSSQLSQPEEANAKVVEPLRKAGLSEEELQQTPEPKPRIEDLKPAITNASPSIPLSAVTSEKRAHSDSAMVSPTSDASHDELERPSIRKKSVSFTADTKVAQERPRPESEDGKKTVSFAEKVAVMPAAPPPDSRSVSFSSKVEEIPPLGQISPELQAKPQKDAEAAKEPLQSHEAAGQLGVDEQMSADEVVVPEDESPEDARLRREMLDYHLNEVGNVVAQIDLDEAAMEMDSNAEDEDDNSSYYTTSEYPDDEDTPYTTGLSESEESEDEFGRSKRRQVTPGYRKQMEDLQQRLIGNLGPEPKDEDIEVVDPELEAKDVRKLVIRDKRNSTSSASSDNSEKKSGGKKRVSFAESLDVAEPGSPPLKAQKLQERENVAPVADTVAERTTAASHSLPEGMANEKASMFRNSRAAPIAHPEGDLSTTPGYDLEMADAAATIDEPPSGPPGIIIADTLMERTPARKPVSAPSADDPDPITQRRELAAEYYRRRNDMVRQQGGFRSNADEDEEQGELMEEKDGKVKKVSRFKAARLKS